jgi:hypothetical protein
VNKLALSDLTRLYTTEVQQPWQQQLYGPRQIIFDPDKTIYDELVKKSKAEEDEGKKTKNADIGYYADEAGRDSRDPINRGREPNITDPDYWAGQFTPEFGWKDTLKAYGPHMAATAMNPITGVLNFARDIANPTNDPAWRSSAQQYLDSVGSPTSLADLIKSINTNYQADPLGAKVFAKDAAMGNLMAEGPWGDVYDQLSEYGLEPYEAWQSAMGANAIGLNPMDSTAYGAGLSTSGLDTLNSYGYTGPNLSNLVDIHTNLLRQVKAGNLSPTGPAAKAAQRTQERLDKINATNNWMNDTLAGRTTDDFDSWSDNGGDGGNRNSGGMKSDNASNTPSPGSRNTGSYSHRSQRSSGGGGGNASAAAGRSAGARQASGRGGPSGGYH